MIQHQYNWEKAATSIFNRALKVKFRTNLKLLISLLKQAKYYVPKRKSMSRTQAKIIQEELDQVHD